MAKKNKPEETEMQTKTKPIQVQANDIFASDPLNQQP
jgi:hypothetical protein